MTKFWQKIGKMFEELLFPENYKCIFCGKDVPDFENKPFCEDCKKEVSFNNKHRCMICAEPIDNEANVCDECQKAKRYFKKAFCPFVYEGLVRKTILKYKDDNCRYLAKTFAKFIAKEVLDSKISIDAITFVPLTKKKQKIRSFNQAELLAVEIGKILNVKVVDMLEKVKDEKSQKALTFRERQSNIKGLFVLRKLDFSKYHSVLLVDDIITTCATINYCSKVLSKKFSSVYVCSIARNKLKK